VRCRITTGSPAGVRPAKTYRGSKRRVRRIRMRGNGSWEMWMFVVWVAFLLFVVVPWMIRNSH
jgi:hypothetical protein